MSDANRGLCLGLVGGLGVGAAAHYYQQLAKAHASLCAQLNLVLIHADVGHVLRLAAAGDTDSLAVYLADLIARMAAAGAQLAAIPAVTAHIGEPRLNEISSLPLVSLVEEIVREVHLRNIHRVALFGTRFTIESAMFGRLREFEVVLPQADEIDFIHETYLQIVNSGACTGDRLDRLRQIAQGLCHKDGVEAVILAGTELSLVFHSENTDFPCIDGARLHLEAIMRRLFAGTD